MSKYRVLPMLAVLFAAGIVFTSCSKDDEPMAQVRISGVIFDNGDDFQGDVDGDFMGTGGTETRNFIWNNSLNTADYNADITATAEGSFKMVVTDADQTVVLDRTLEGAVEPDSFSGVTSSGTSGIWTVTISLTNFSGDGSFSLSQGN